MKRYLAFAFLFAVAASAAAATENPPSAPPSSSHTQTRPTDFKTMFTPYAHPGDGDNDGLSRDGDDCMKGCIGGEPG